MTIEWHTEDCADRRCGGECHVLRFDCGECGDYVELEASEFLIMEKAGGSIVCECGEVIDPYGDAGPSDAECRAAERRQMGFCDF